MTVTGPRVRDFTDSQPALEVEIVASSAAELVTSLFALGSEADPSIDAADAERRGLWADGVRDGASDELRSLNEEGTTILMVTHSSAHADYARRTVNLFDGHVVTDSKRAA